MIKYVSVKRHLMITIEMNKTIHENSAAIYGKKDGIGHRMITFIHSVVLTPTILNDDRQN